MGQPPGISVHLESKEKRVLVGTALKQCRVETGSHERSELLISRWSVITPCLGADQCGGYVLPWILSVCELTKHVPRQHELASLQKQAPQCSCSSDPMRSERNLCVGQLSLPCRGLVTPNEVFASQERREGSWFVITSDTC